MIESLVDPTRYFLLLLNEGVNGLGGVVVLSHGGGRSKRKRDAASLYIFKG